MEELRKASGQAAVNWILDQRHAPYLLTTAVGSMQLGELTSNSAECTNNVIRGLRDKNYLALTSGLIHYMMSLFEKEKAAANACPTAVCMPTLEAMVRVRDEHKNGKWSCSMGFVEHIEGAVKAAVSVMSGAVAFRVTLNTAAVGYEERVVCRCRYSARGYPCFHAGLALEHAAAHAALIDSHVILQPRQPAVVLPTSDACRLDEAV